MSDFSEVLKALRSAFGMTQDELSKALGISRSRIGMYELGQREPDFETLEKLADYFNVDYDFLLGRTNKTTLLPESGYYGDPEIRKTAQAVFDNPSLRLLFEAAQGVSSENIELAAEMLKRFKETNPNG